MRSVVVWSLATVIHARSAAEMHADTTRPPRGHYTGLAVRRRLPACDLDLPRLYPNFARCL